MKKLSKKFFALILVLGLLTGCAGRDEPAADEPEGETAEQPITISLSHEANPGEGRYLAAEKWKELVEERSGGSITVNLYPSSQLGSKDDVMEQILMDEPILLNTDGSFLCEYGAPEIAILSMPYVFDTWDQVDELMASDWFAEQEAQLAENGIRVVNANWVLGERQLITTKPVYELADLKGMKIRVPNNTMSVVEFECFGAASTPMALGDVYTSLQQGTIDGQENPIDFLYNGGYGEVCDYVTLTGHVKMPLQWVMSENVWNRMSANQQEILVETCPLPVKGAAFLRETVMSDRATGQKLVQIYTSWMLVNTSDWKVMRPSAFPYDMVRGEMDADPAIFKWKVDTTAGQVVGIRPIYYSDLDNNGHANNAVYGDIATDFLPTGILQEKEVASFLVHYQKEGALGEELTIHRAAIDEDHYDIWGEGPDSRCFEAKVALR